MTVQLLSFPFRLNPAGAAITADDDSAQYCAERLSVILGTRPGERPLAPDFGVNDPAFQGYTDQALRIQVSRVGLPIDITNVRRRHLDDAREQVTIEFDMLNHFIYGGS